MLKLNWRHTGTGTCIAQLYVGSVHLLELEVEPPPPKSSGWAYSIRGVDHALCGLSDFGSTESECCALAEHEAFMLLTEALKRFA